MITIMYAMMNHEIEGRYEESFVLPPDEYQIAMFKVPVEVDVNGEMQEYPSYTCILYRPGQKMKFVSKEKCLRGDWIRFRCDEPLYTEYFLPFGIPVVCPKDEYFSRYWQAVADENYWKHESSAYVADQLMHIILHRLHDYALISDSYVLRDAFLHLRKEIYQHPEAPWTLEMMADMVNLSTRAVQKRYKMFFRSTCMSDVIESRITHAKILLTQTDHSIQEISTECGYNNFEHFCRQFKKIEGITPSKYRSQK